MEEREEVEVRADHRETLAARVEHIGDLELAVGERVGLDEQFACRRPGLPECRFGLFDAPPTFFHELLFDEIGLLGDRGVLRDLWQVVEHTGIAQRGDVLDHGLAGDCIP